VGIVRGGADIFTGSRSRVFTIGYCSSTDEEKKGDADEEVSLADLAAPHLPDPKRQRAKLIAKK
jgi:hypothetical protein